MHITSSAANKVFANLHGRYGPQYWWPANSDFEVMLGAVLTQNTSWRNVEKALANLRARKGLTLRGLAAMRDATLARCLRPSGYYNVKTKRVRALSEWLLAAGGVARLRRRDTASLRAELLSVHGIGPETADTILLYSLGRPVFVIDAYTRRLLWRLGWATGDEPYERLQRGFQDALAREAQLYNEYHALIVAHGKEHCRSKPVCQQCCLRGQCKYPGKRGNALNRR